MPKLLTQILVFCGIGGAITAVALCLMILLTHYTNLHFAAVNAIGYAFGLTLAFFLHRNFTFAETALKSPAHGQVAPFVIIFAVGYIIQMIVLFAAIRYLGLPEMVGQVLASATYAVISFTGNRLLTFRV